MIKPHYTHTKLPDWLEWLRTIQGHRFKAYEYSVLQQKIIPLMTETMSVSFDSWVPEQNTKNILQISGMKLENQHSVAVITALDKLPFAAASIGCVWVPHCLPFVLNPTEVLGEIARVLKPEGQVYISGFNLLGLWRLGRFCRQMPWQIPVYSAAKLRTWLLELGFADFQIDYHGGLPWLRDRRNIGLDFMATLYLLRATKTTLGFIGPNAIVKKNVFKPISG